MAAKYANAIKKSIKLSGLTGRSISKALGFQHNYLSHSLHTKTMHETLIDYLLTIDGITKEMFFDIEVVKKKDANSVSTAQKILRTKHAINQDQPLKLRIGDTCYLVNEDKNVEFTVIEEYPNYYLLKGDLYYTTISRHGDDFSFYFP